jgi:WD40 repeat protein
VEYANSLSARNGVVALTYVDVDKFDYGPFDLVLWEAATNQVQASFPLVDVPYEMTSVQLHPDHNMVATISGRGGGEVWLWDVATGERIRVLEGVWFACGFLNDGEALVSVGPDGLALRDWRGGQPITSKRQDAAEFRHGHNCDLAISPDGSYLAFGTGALREKGTLHVWTLDGVEVRQAFEFEYADLVESVAISPDSRFVAAADCRGITVCNIGKRAARTDEEREEMFIPGTEILSLAYAPDRKTLVAGSTSGIRFYHAKTGREIGHVPLHQSIDGVRFADENTLAYISLYGAGVLRTSRKE